MPSHKEEHIMLELRNITKTYELGPVTVPALDNVSLIFEDNAFISILGASGSGKTTMLNIVGGLDRYTSGDLLIEGKSTKTFTDREWDSYRNQAIGFVFQNYNLISHLSIQGNVEMALRLSGIPSSERKTRARKALEDVGLIDHASKRPNQLSGGQMQRVAIARALVNNPKVLLADEPTGALDSKTSIQIMELIKEISKDRLVIMVTHNAEIANAYSDRIIRLVDGKVADDTRPVRTKDRPDAGRLTGKRTAMGYLTALKTSFTNLLTKKGRTFITAIAGSIGIIGIALVLSISTGMTSYVDNLENDTLAGFPVTIQENVVTEAFGPARAGEALEDQSAGAFPDDGVITSYDEEANTIVHTNILSEDFLDHVASIDPSLVNTVSYTRSMVLNMVVRTSAGNYTRVRTESAPAMPFLGAQSIVFEVPDSPDFILSQYDLLAGAYPDSFDDVILVVDSHNRIDTDVLGALGIASEDTYGFEDFLGMTIHVIPNNVYYTDSGDVFVPGSDYEAMATSDDAVTVTVAGILRVNEEATSEILSSGIGYTTALTDHMLALEADSDIVTAQKADPSVNILSGMPFTSQITYDDVMKAIGGDATPTGVQIYPVGFDEKDLIKDHLDAYNEGRTEEETIIYSDLAETLSSAISDLIGTITIVLSAFAAISLVVSSIMIGIITYVSVVERTKEIGIMRSLGARKKDISRIFNAETVLIGFSAGLLGIIIAMLLNIPVNAIINNFVGVAGLSTLTFTHAVLLVVLSTFLTLIAGLIPSGIAARKDPVIALRTE
jgi:putative ABC transport system permease protein